MSRERQRQNSNANEPPSAQEAEATPHPDRVGEVRTELPAHALTDRLPKAGTPRDRERVEAELRRLTAIVRNSNDAVTIQTLDGEILAWNRGAELTYGYREAEVVGTNVRKLIPPDVQKEADALAGRVAAGETVGSFEALIR